MTAFIDLKPVGLHDVLAIYAGSNGSATQDLYARLEGCGPVGVIVMNLFRAEKASSRAKDGRRFKTKNYEKKNWSMGNLSDVLFKHGDALGINWGWAEDGSQPFHRWVLYVDAPAGQVSFHAEARGAGPLYSKPWDRIKGQGPTRISRWAVDLLNGKADPAAPIASAVAEEIGKVIQARFTSETETERQRFELWAGSQVGPAEASTLLARSKGGDYVLATARGAWAAWLARGLVDAKRR